MYVQAFLSETYLFSAQLVAKIFKTLMPLRYFSIHRVKYNYTLAFM